MWAGYQGLITTHVGSDFLVLVFIVVIIGGLGSIEGSLLGAILVGLNGQLRGLPVPETFRSPPTCC